MNDQRLDKIDQPQRELALATMMNDDDDDDNDKRFEAKTSPDSPAPAHHHPHRVKAGPRMSLEQASWGLPAQDAPKRQTPSARAGRSAMAADGREQAPVLLNPPDRAGGRGSPIRSLLLTQGGRNRGGVTQDDRPKARKTMMMEKCEAEEPKESAKVNDWLASTSSSALLAQTQPPSTWIQEERALGAGPREITKSRRFHLVSVDAIHMVQYIWCLSIMLCVPGKTPTMACSPKSFRNAAHGQTRRTDADGGTAIPNHGLLTRRTETRRTDAMRMDGLVTLAGAL